MDDLHREIPVDHRVNVKYVSTRGAIVGAKHACRLKIWKTSVTGVPFRTVYDGKGVGGWHSCGYFLEDERL